MPNAQQLAEALQFSFDESSHVYKREGVTVPSVTQLLEDAGLSSVAGVPIHLLERKAMIGTETHKAANFVDSGASLDDLELDAAVVPYVRAYQKFRSEHAIAWELSEHRFTAYRENLWYGGCLDRYGLLDGEPTVLDIKTSHSPAKHWRLQLSGYALAVNVAADRVALHLRPDESYRLIEYQSAAADHDAFGAALRLWYWRRAS